MAPQKEIKYFFCIQNKATYQYINLYQFICALKVVDTFQKNIDLMVSKIKTDQLDNITVEIYEPEPMSSSFDPHLQIVSKFGKRNSSLAVTDNFLNSFVSGLGSFSVGLFSVLFISFF